MWSKSFSIFLLLSLTAALPQTINEGNAANDPWWLGLADADATTESPTVQNEPEPVTLVEENPKKKQNTPFQSEDKPERRFSSGNQCDLSRGWTCVPYYLCDGQNIITDGAGLFDIRAGSLDLDCPRNLEVCCRLPDVIDHVDVIPPIVDNTCGKRNGDGVHVRLSGLQSSETQFGEFPWMVAILKFEKIGQKEINLFICGGSLIAYDIVLTAAHCVYPYSNSYLDPTSPGPNLKVRAGEWDTQLTSEIYQHIDSYVKNIVHHEEFNPASLANDLAVMRLETPFPSVPHISPICMPPPNVGYDHLDCFATGWGRETFHGNFQNVMKKVPLIPYDSFGCQEALRTTRLGSFFQLHKSFLCAGGEPSVDTCKGDGGSPLVCTPDNTPIHDPDYQRYFQVGIVAWGIGCGETGIPGVYANVADFQGWIQDTIHRL